MSVYLLPLAAALLVLGASWVVVQWIRDWLRRISYVQSASFDVQPRTVAPDDVIKLTAKVVPAGKHRVRVEGVVVCALLEHRERRIHEHAYDLHGETERHAEVKLPHEMLRAGAVGNELSNLFSEDVHRALIQWFVEFRVIAENGELVMTRRIPLDVPNGRALVASRQALEEVIVEKCAKMHSDLVLNWLVHLANADGSIAEPERQLLRQILETAHDVRNEAEADHRILTELEKKIGVDPLVVRNHMPPEMLNEFYRLLYAMAWRDGDIQKVERAFLTDAMKKIGLDSYQVDELEREVLADVAAHSIR